MRCALFQALTSRSVRYVRLRPTVANTKKYSNINTGRRYKFGDFNASRRNGRFSRASSCKGCRGYLVLSIMMLWTRFYLVTLNQFINPSPTLCYAQVIANVHPFSCVFIGLPQSDKNIDCMLRFFNYNPSIGYAQVIAITHRIFSCFKLPYHSQTRVYRLYRTLLNR